MVLIGPWEQERMGGLKRRGRSEGIFGVPNNAERIKGDLIEAEIALNRE